MFSKALFKQSCKANRTMWGIITFATCFMLACVMLISGSGNIGTVKNSIQDTIITKELDSQMQKRALSYYENANDGLQKFDLLFVQNATDTLSYLVWLGNMPKQSDFTDINTYMIALNAWQEVKPQMQTSAGESYALLVGEWQNAMPIRDNFDSDTNYALAMQTWQEQSPATQQIAVTTAYTFACEDLQTYVKQKP